MNRKRISLTMKENEKREPVSKPVYNKPAQKQVNAGPSTRDPAKTFNKKAEVEPEGDLQLKLAALKNMFK